MTATDGTNFRFLAKHDQQLVRLSMLAERFFPEDPNTSLLKVRQMAELLAQLTATRAGLYASSAEGQYDLIRRLQDSRIVPREVAQLFGEVRRAGNAANHEIVGDHRTALSSLKLVWQLGLWYHRTFKDRAYTSGASAGTGTGMRRARRRPSGSASIRTSTCRRSCERFAQGARQRVPAHPGPAIFPLRPLQ